jgi:hypothetical protein
VAAHASWINFSATYPAVIFGNSSTGGLKMTTVAVESYSRQEADRRVQERIVYLEKMLKPMTDELMSLLIFSPESEKSIGELFEKVKKIFIRINELRYVSLHVL